METQKISLLNMESYFHKAQKKSISFRNKVSWHSDYIWIFWVLDGSLHLSWNDNWFLTHAILGAYSKRPQYNRDYCMFSPAAHSVCGGHLNNDSQVHLTFMSCCICCALSVIRDTLPSGMFGLARKMQLFLGRVKAVLIEPPKRISTLIPHLDWGETAADH